jgi:hypothetical protein
MKDTWLSRALWLAWHPWELIKLIVKSLVLGVIIILAYANEAIDEAKK